MSKIYYYVNTGHRVGLDRFRRASAVIEELQDLDITLLTNDFRIASLAKAYFFKRAVGIDVIRNIPNIAQRDDLLIYDSQEHSPVILDDMRDFFARMVRFTDASNEEAADNETLISSFDASLLPVASIFEDVSEKKENVVFFYGDDDYEEDFLALAKESELDEVEALLGFYYFLDGEEKLRPYFKDIIDEEDYAQTIKEAGLLITCSYQAALEANVTKTPVVFLQRVDYDQNYSVILEKLGILTAPFEAITKEKITAWKQSTKIAPLENGAKKVAQIIKNSFS